jgi:hypothetical protein
MSWKDEIVQRVVAAREPSAPAATIPAQPAPAAPVAHAPAAAATDYRELWRKVIARVSPPSPVAGVLGHEPAPGAHAPAVAPAPAAMDYAAMWARAKAKASAPVIAQLKAMGLK